MTVGGQGTRIVLLLAVSFLTIDKKVLDDVYIYRRTILSCIFKDFRIFIKWLCGTATLLSVVTRNFLLAFGNSLLHRIRLFRFGLFLKLVGQFGINISNL